MSLYAAGLAPYRLEAYSGAVEFFPDVSRDFQLAFFERESDKVCSVWPGNPEDTTSAI